MLSTDTGEPIPDSMVVCDDVSPAPPIATAPLVQVNVTSFLGSNVSEAEVVLEFSYDAVDVSSFQMELVSGSCASDFTIADVHVLETAASGKSQGTGRLRIQNAAYSRGAWIKGLAQRYVRACACAYVCRGVVCRTTRRPTDWKCSALDPLLLLAIGGAAAARGLCIACHSCTRCR